MTATYHGMRGARPLLDDEISGLKEYFKQKMQNNPHKNDLRDKTFILLGFYVGFRASELLSIKLRDVWDGKKVTDYISISKKNTKGKQSGKTSPIFGECKAMLEEYIMNDCITPRYQAEWLFSSPMGGPLSYRQMLRCLKFHFENCELTGKLSTHTLRKTFAHKMYKQLGNDLPSLQAALNHKSINSTVSYVQINREKITEGIKSLSF